MPVALCRLPLAACLALVWLLTTAMAVAASPDPMATDRTPTVHGLALYDEPALPADFPHFPHVNPEAPRGGTLTQAAVGGSFDSTNPFIIRGTPAAGLFEIYDTLVEGNPDEPFSVYGLLAEGMRLDPERNWIEFDLRPEARFHDGEPVTADDVVYSFELLTEQGNPFYGAYYADVESVTALDERTVRFHFAEVHSRELPLIVGQLPVLPKHYWEARDFTAPSLAAHPGSGPYRIAEVDPGRRIVYQRDPDYWGRDLAVKRGRHNIDRLVYDYYRDRDIAWEAFKAGVLDYRIDARAATWAIGYDFPAYRDGLVRRLAVPDGQPARMQAFVFNLRRDKFDDPGCARRSRSPSTFPGSTPTSSTTPIGAPRATSRTPRWPPRACRRARSWPCWSPGGTSCPSGSSRSRCPTSTRWTCANGYAWRWTCCARRATRWRAIAWSTARPASR